MSFVEAMLLALPPLNGITPHITGIYAEQGATGSHRGLTSIMQGVNWMS